MHFVRMSTEVNGVGGESEEKPIEREAADTMPIDNPQTAKEEERTLTDHLNKKLLESFLARMDAGTTGFPNLPQAQPHTVEDEASDFD